jgi:cytochrome c peroxidase
MFSRMWTAVLALALALPVGAELVIAKASPAEAYRRLVFLVNLNPVDWALVRAEATALEVAGAIPTSVTAPAERKQAARAAFEAATRVVVKRTLQALAAAKSSGGDQAARIDEARKLWACFEPEIPVTDPAAHARLAGAWKPEGLAELETYLGEAYGAEYTLPAGAARLAPLPVGSKTFNKLTSPPLVLPPGSVIAKQVPRPRQVLNMAARGVSEAETALIALGDMAFDSPHIFGEPARSAGIACSTCHNKGTTNPKFFVPGLSARPGGMDVSNAFFAPHANDGHYGHLDTPDMRGIRFTAPYGRNGRFASLREFTRNVIVNEFNGAEPDPILVDAMVAYFNEFDFLPNAALKPDGRLADQAPAAAKRGEKLFNTPFAGMGGRACATCHVPSDHFLDRKRHDIGTVNGATPGSRDRALDTPTLLSAKHTPPYFHDGSQPTLRAVVEWFDKRFALKLSGGQVSDLTAYLETIGDGEEAFEASPHFLASEMEELSFFLSTYEFLKARYKWDLIATLFTTVAGELRAHVVNLQDAKHAPTMEKLAVILEEARAASKRGDVPGADAKVEEYRRFYQEQIDALK